MTIIGYDFYGTQFFRSPGNAIKDIFYGEIKGGIYDELEIRDRTDTPTDKGKTKWEIDHRAIFKFAGDLEGGNISNSGLEIVSFAIKRRRVNEIDSVTLDHIPFVNNLSINYEDYTQPNDELIYTIVPIAQNDLGGKPVEVHVKSDFVGWWLVDKETDAILGFDSAIGEIGSVETALNQGRTVIETLSRFPSVYYFDKDYHTFSLSTAIIPSEFERSGQNYEKIVNTFIRDHRPFIVKSDTGRIFVCDCSNPRFSTPLNTWRDYDYGVLTIDFLEIQDYNEFMNE
ncbi:hypothetical protein PC41400_14430 [Paenibacillus chitinolyticus]|uniref:Uncharacterized protein n=1 Tax=Paenibacillus chitinolyticus TaxID=79263 RepID=A0A410WWU1_9BACL|nr:hypothetical protein [Paenibacillus chitinolyticus]MCY9598561.1 hypothetical protein [Paenibacillus chitinolyticus]QAV18810.1 hypothetical protein PC41400_14430 [Paenibacillus chitinolyticus]